MVGLDVVTKCDSGFVVKLFRNLHVQLPLINYVYGWSDNAAFCLAWSSLWVDIHLNAPANCVSVNTVE